VKNKAQIGRFAIVGTINTIIDFGLLFLLTFLGLPKLTANTISTGTAFVFSFFANKKYTFKSTSKNIKYEMVSFVIVTLFGLWVLQNGTIWLITPLIKSFITNERISLFVAKLFATAISLIWNYCLYERIVFRKESS
jgi:hypothetical protein cdiviTM7_02105